MGQNRMIMILEMTGGKVQGGRFKDFSKKGFHFFHFSIPRRVT